MGYKSLQIQTKSSSNQCARKRFEHHPMFVRRIRLSNRTGVQKPTQADGIQLRAKVASVLKSSKPPKQNVNKEERQAIKDLQKADDIIILPEVKGKSAVILDKNEYEKKVSNMLADKKTYEELPDLTPKYKRKLVSILTNRKKEDKISEAK